MNRTYNSAGSSSAQNARLCETRPGKYGHACGDITASGNRTGGGIAGKWERDWTPGNDIDPLGTRLAQATTGRRELTLLTRSRRSRRFELLDKLRVLGRRDPLLGYGDELRGVLA
jgi:hypothetical protein